MNVSNIFEEFITEYYPESNEFIPLIMQKKQEKELLSQKKAAFSEKSFDVSAHLKTERKNFRFNEICETLFYLSQITRMPVSESKKRDFINKKWQKLFDNNLPKEVQNVMTGISSLITRFIHFFNEFLNNSPLNSSIILH